MDLTIYPGLLRGNLRAIPSKSQAHRVLICAAFADHSSRVLCGNVNRDMEATASCLRSLGAGITRTDWGYAVEPVSELPRSAELNCCESGSTLRFLLPVAGALGVDTLFHLEGRLPQRPLSPLWEEMERMGCSLSRPSADTLRCRGKLKSGTFRISGGVSSQYITGLLLALPHLAGDSWIQVQGKLESRPYVQMTLDVLNLFGIQQADFRVPGNQIFHSPGDISIEGDWSSAAFFLAANALGSQTSLSGLNPASSQGDRAVGTALEQIRRGIAIDASDIPDLIPVLAIVAGAGSGGVFHNISRLRLKESDRVQTILDTIQSLGGHAEATENTLTVAGAGYAGGMVSSAGDHRIAMAAAIAATVCRQPVTLLGAEAVSKSYPGFWEDYQSLGGHYEQYIR